MTSGLELYPLTPQQRTMLDFMAGNTDSYYLLCEAFHLHGTVDVESLRGAFAGAVRRHGVLRSRYRREDNGYRVEPYAAVTSDEVVRVSGVDGGVDGAWRSVSGQICRPMAVDTESPLRVELCRAGPRDWVLAVAAHHLVADGWSFRLLWNDIESGYHRPVRSPAPQYWEASAAPAGSHHAGWSSLLRRTYGAIRDVNARARGPLGAAERYQRAAGGGLDAALATAAERFRTTPYVIGAAAFLRALSDTLDDPQVIVGTPTAGRTTAAAVRSVGYFATSLFVGADLSARATDADLIRHVASQAADWLAAPRIQWEPLLDAHRARDLYPIKFTCQRVALRREPRLDGVRMATLPAVPSDWTRRPLTFAVLFGGGTVTLQVTFRRDAFAKPAIEELAGVFLTRLRAMCR